MKLKLSFNVLVYAALLSAGIWLAITEAAKEFGLSQVDRVEINLGGPAAVDNFQLNSIPEPASMFLLGTGLIVIAGVGRKKFFKKKGSKRS